MWATVKEPLILIAGAAISIVSIWIESRRTRKWVLADRKLDREIAAREVRLKEGEDKMKEFTSEFFYVERLLKFLLYPESSSVVVDLHNRYLRSYVKTWEEKDKEKAMNEISVKSLGDERLTKAWGKSLNSFHEYKDFYVDLEQVLTSKGITFLQKEYKENSLKEQVLKQSFLSSVEEFLRRINELRSQ